MASSLSANQIAQLLVFLDRFRDNVLTLDKVNILEKNFLEAANSSIIKSLAVLNLQAKCENNQLHLQQEDKARCEISTLRAQLQSQICHKGVFDYGKNVAQIVTLGKDFLFKLRDYISKYDAKQNGKIANISTHIIDIDHSKTYSDSFEQTRQYMYFASESKIFHPDPNQFGESQWKLWYSMASKKETTGWIDYYYLDHIWPMHEIMHCVRFDVPSDDEIPEYDETEKLLYFFKHGNWHGEFGASFAQLDFLYLVVKGHPQLFLPGFAEECILQFADRIYWHHTSDPKVTPELKQGYIQWRDSCALKDPLEVDSTVLNQENNNSYEYYLGRLAVEHFTFGKKFGTFLDESFKGWEESFGQKDYEAELIKRHSFPNKDIPTIDIASWFEQTHSAKFSCM